jgi:hypothetical protein
LRPLWFGRTRDNHGHRQGVAGGGRRRNAREVKPPA